MGGLVKWRGFDGIGGKRWEEMGCSYELMREETSD